MRSSPTLDRTGERLLRSDSSGFQRFRSRVASIADGLDADAAGEVADIVVRFMRTPSFLVRFVDLSPTTSGSTTSSPASSAATSAGRPWPTGSERSRGPSAQKVDIEREALIEALHRIQTGGIAAVTDDFDESERSARTGNPDAERPPG